MSIRRFFQYICWLSLFLAGTIQALWVNAGLPGISVTTLAVSDTDLFAATNGCIYRSTIGGWARTGFTSPSTSPNTDILAIVGSDTNLFAGTSGGVFISNNRSNSWIQVNSGLPYFNYSGTFYYFVYSLAVSDTNLFVGTGIHGVFRSTNNGTNWTQVNSGLTDTVIRALAVSGTNIFAGTDSGVFRSTNNGNSWSRVSSGLTSRYIKTIAISDTNIFAGTSGGVFLSTNNGNSWVRYSPTIVYTSISALAVYGPNLFVGTSNGGVIRVTDNGETWTQVDSGLAWTAGISVSAFAIYGTNLFIGIAGSSWASGIWKRPLSEMIIGIETAQNQIPFVHALDQNYPNPFNPSTSINYIIPDRQKGLISLYSRDGSCVLKREVQGCGTFHWNAEKKASGIYLCKLTTGQGTFIRKMILIR